MTTTTLSSILAVLPCTPTTTPDPEMVWRHKDFNSTLRHPDFEDDGHQAMTGAAAVALLRSEGWTGVIGPAGGLIHGRTPNGLWLTYAAEHPAPADWHDAAGVLESDLLAKGVSDELAAALVHTVRAAIDGFNPGPGLLQFLAAWVRS